MSDRAVSADPATTVELTEQIVKQHQNSLWRYLRFLGCDPAAADDLAQETFLALATKRLPNRGSAALNGWLRGTAHNLVRARRRQLRRELKFATTEEIDVAWKLYAQEDHGASYRDALRGCLTMLDEREQLTLERRYTNQDSREAIAAELGVGIEGVKSILRRAKAALRTCIEAKTR